MGRSMTKANSKSHISSSQRRGARALCEALEERQLMSLTIEVRDASGGSSATATSVGQVLNLQLLAVITSPIADSASTDGLDICIGSILSNAVDGHAVAGNLAAANVAPFKATGSSPGAQVDLNGDGNIDVGAPQSAGTAGNFFTARSDPIATGQSGVGTISGNSLIFEIGTLSYTVTSLNKGGTTAINFSPFVNPQGLTANWYEDGQNENSAEGTFQAGTPYLVSDSALVTAPVAVNDTVTVVKNTPTTINELSVDDIIEPLNDSSVTIKTGAAHGTTALQTNGSILYTPSTGYTGPDSFSYTVADTGGRVSNPATVNITVVNAPLPVAGADSVTTLLNTPATINVLAVDSATAPAKLVPGSVTIVTGTTHGTAVVQTNGSVLYTPATAYTGTDSFTYTVTDTNQEISTAGTVTITVTTPVAPSLITDPLPETTSAGAPLTVAILSDVKPGSGTLAASSVKLVSQPTDGTAVLNADGSILYTPTPKFTGSDSFTYSVTDSLGLTTGVGTVAITVTASVPPVATNVVAPVMSGGANTINVLANVSSGAPVVPGSVTIVAQPKNGTATVNASTGAISYTPVAGFIGTDTFTYTVGNTNLDTSNPATVSVNVGTSISSAKGSAHSLSFTDAAGGLETISLNRGSAQIYFTGTGSLTTSGSKATVTGSSLDLGSITLTGTTAASSLSIRGSVKTPVTLAGITDASPLGSIVAPSANLSGVINLSGVGSLVVGSISGATITIGAGAPGRIALTAGAITNSTLTSAVPITSLKAASWTGTTGAITAPSIASLQIAGAFSPSLTLTSNGRALALGSARITGALSGGNWNVAGSIGTVTAGSVAGTWTGSLHNLNSFVIKTGGLASNVSAGAIGTLSIGGNLTGDITATGAVKTIRVSGAVSGSSIDAGGIITSVSAGSITGSTITAGIGAGVTVANATAATVGGAAIRSVRTGSFSASSIIAGALGAISLGTVTTANSGTTFGVASKTISSFAGVFGATAIHAGHGVLTNEEVLQAYLGQQGASLGDFSIQILS